MKCGARVVWEYLCLHQKVGSPGRYLQCATGLQQLSTTPRRPICPYGTWIRVSETTQLCRSSKLWSTIWSCHYHGPFQHSGLVYWWLMCLLTKVPVLARFSIGLCNFWICSWWRERQGSADPQLSSIWPPKCPRLMYQFPRLKQMNPFPV